MMQFYTVASVCISCVVEEVHKHLSIFQEFHAFVDAPVWWFAGFAAGDLLIFVTLFFEVTDQY